MLLMVNSEVYPRADFRLGLQADDREDRGRYAFEKNARLSSKHRIVRPCSGIVAAREFTAGINQSVQGCGINVYSGDGGHLWVAVRFGSFSGAALLLSAAYGV